MSLPVAYLNGYKVFATDHENLEGVPVKCLFCGAKMHVQKFPNVDRWHFVLYPGESHKNDECRRYQSNHNLPLLKYSCCEDLILSMIPRSSGVKKTTGGGGSKGNKEKELNSGIFPKIHSLEGILKAGVIKDGPYQPVYGGSKLVNLDFIVPRAWANLIWKNGLIKIHGRVIEAQFMHSLNLKSDTMIYKIKERCNESKQLWFSVAIGRYKESQYVRFCLDCKKGPFVDIKNKLFDSTVRENGTYDDFAIRTKVINNREYQLKRALIAAIWHEMSRDECTAICPLNSYSICNKCIGAYCGKALSKNHVLLMDYNYSEVYDDRYI